MSEEKNDKEHIQNTDFPSLEEVALEKRRLMTHQEAHKSLGLFTVIIVLLILSVFLLLLLLGVIAFT